MAQLNYFDASQVSPQDNFTPLAAGDYLVMAIDSEVKITKNGMGSYLAISLQVLDGPNAGRMVWDNIQLQNNNPQTVEIGQRQLSGICHATGVLQLSDSSQLHNIPVVARVIVKNDPAYGPKNEIKAYKPANQQAAGAPQPFSQPPMAQPPQQAPMAQPQQQPPMGYPQQAPMAQPQQPMGYPQQQPGHHQAATGTVGIPPQAAAPRPNIPWKR